MDEDAEYFGFSGKNENQYRQFFNNVIIKLGYYDWTIRFCNDNYCWIKNKRIDVDIDQKGDIYQMILHEIAHIDTAKYCNQKHNPTFWKKLEYLTWKFLKHDIDENQKRHKQFMSNGYISIKYKD